MMSGTEKIAVLIEDWELHDNYSPYRAPEAICSWMTGTVFGHPYHEDGSFVTTSAVIGSTMTLARKGHTLETNNTKYKLGDKKNL